MLLENADRNKGVGHQLMHKIKMAITSVFSENPSFFNVGIYLRETNNAMEIVGVFIMMLDNLHTH